MSKGRGPMMPGGLNMNAMMKQVQKMQEDMARTQAELEQKSFEASAGGGAVRVTVSGKRQLESLTIDPGVVDAEDIEMLQDLILIATNEALRTAEEAVAQEMGKVSGGLNIPGIF